jgi:hypothetical protein
VTYYGTVTTGGAWTLLRSDAPARLPRFHLPVWRAAGGAVCLLLVMAARQAPRPVYVLSIMNLGAEQALFLTTPGGQSLLLDGGDTPSRLDAALGSRLPFWNARIDAVLAGDVDAAHVGGLHGLLSRYAVGRALDTGAVFPSGAYAQWRADTRNAGVAEAKLRAGMRLRLDAHAYLDVLQPFALNPDGSPAPCALRLVAGRFSLLYLSNAALFVDPASLVADGRRRDTVLVLPSGVGDPTLYTSVIALLRPLLVVLPSLDDTHGNPTADAAAVHAARAIGARAWQAGDGAALALTTDGMRLAQSAGNSS